MEGIIERYKFAALFRAACAPAACFGFDIVQRNDILDCNHRAHTRPYRSPLLWRVPIHSVAYIGEASPDAICAAGPR